MAYRRLELLPREFYLLTPYEFDALCEAKHALVEEQHDAMRAQIRREAYWVSQLMNASGHMQEAMTPDKLLGEGPAPKEQHEEELERLKQRAEERRAQRLKERAERVHGIEPR